MYKQLAFVAKTLQPISSPRNYRTLPVSQSVLAHISLAQLIKSIVEYDLHKTTFNKSWADDSFRYKICLPVTHWMLKWLNFASAEETTCCWQTHQPQCKTRSLNLLKALHVLVLLLLIDVFYLPLHTIRFNDGWFKQGV